MNIVKSGDCRTASQKEQQGVKMIYTLDDEGVLTIIGNDFLLADIVSEPVDDEDEEEDEVCFVSQFKDLDFHTAVIMPEVMGLGDSCFSGCRNLSEVIVDESGLYLHTKFVDESQNVEVNEENLWPRYIEYQMWHANDYGQDD